VELRETPFKSQAERRDWPMNLPQQFNKVYSGQKAQAERGSDVEDQEEDGDNEERAQALRAELAGQPATVSRQEDAIDEKSAAKLKRKRKESEGWDTLHSGMVRLAFADGPARAVFRIRHLFDDNHMQISMRAVCFDPSNPSVLSTEIRAKDVLRAFVWELCRKECSRQMFTDAERLEGLSSFVELYNKVKK